jgi:hypothetical protein
MIKTSIDDRIDHIMLHLVTNLTPLTDNLHSILRGGGRHDAGLDGATTAFDKRRRPSAAALRRSTDLGRTVYPDSSTRGPRGAADPGGSLMI